MTVFWLNLVIVFLFSFLARFYSLPVTTNGITTQVKHNFSFVAGVIITLVIISGLRSGIGDTYFYMHSYTINDFTWSKIVEDKDIGFGVLQKILKAYSEDPQLLVFITALITNFLIVSILAKYSRIFELSTYVYITGGLFLVSMNGIRQVLAAAIVFTATKYLINGNWVMYFLIVIVSSLFHQSALVLIPIYFLVRYKAWSRATILLVFLSLAIVAGYEQFSKLLFTAIKDTQYGEYSEFKEGGANILRVFVYGAPLLLAYLGRDKLREIWPTSDYFINMALIGLLFMIVSTQNWIFARFSIYFNLYQLIVLSWTVKLFNTRQQRFVYYCIILFYFLYYFYESVMSLNISYESNFF